MSYIFISHLSDDKPRLGVYIDRLLEELDDDVGLWIDTPEHLREDFGRHPRITAIHPGRRWNEEIERAVKGAGCVLVFWSKNFGTRDREVFIKEVDEGRLTGRCVQVAIDPQVQCKVPAPFNRDQILDVLDLADAASTNKFDRVIEQVKQLISSVNRSGPGPRIDVEVQLLPYLADRHPQIMSICRSVQESYSVHASEQSETSGSLFLVPCGPQDAVDTFNWRLASKDGPEYCGFDVLRDTPGWVTESNLYWPPQQTPQTFIDEFVASNVMPVSAGLTNSRTRKRPVCFSILVAAARLKRDFGGFIGAWIHAWPSLLAQASQRMTEKVRSAPPQPVVILLFLSFDSPGWLSRLVTSLDKRVEARFRQLESLIYGMSDSAIKISPLPPLDPVTYEDATSWLARPEILRHTIYQPARSAVNRMFRRSDARVSMQKFAETVLRSVE